MQLARKGTDHMPAYSRNDLDKMAEALRSLPAATKNKLNTQGVVTLLAAEIIVLQERGYSIEQIAEILRSLGMRIAASTLQTYLGRSKKRRKRRGKVAQATDARQAGGQLPN